MLTRSFFLDEAPEKAAAASAFTLAGLGCQCSPTASPNRYSRKRINRKESYADILNRKNNIKIHEAHPSLRKRGKTFNSSGANHG
jgi:hypothetical protein